MNICNMLFDLSQERANDFMHSFIVVGDIVVCLSLGKLYQKVWNTRLSNGVVGFSGFTSAVLSILSNFVLKNTIQTREFIAFD